MNATVLFADVSGAAISHCIEPLRKAAESAGGRVVKLVGDEVMVLFASPDAAAKAAVKMHQCIEALPAAAGDEPALRVAFHSGPVIQVDKDVLGDTVKLAARLVAQAQRGQTLTRSEEHTSELQSLAYLVCRLLLEKKKKKEISYQEHDTIEKDAVC